MDNNRNTFHNGIEETLNLAPELYNDGIKKTVQETGKIVALLPQTIYAALVPLRKWITEREYSLKETEKLLELKLKNVDPEKIRTPEAYVAVPALQAISYSMDSEELRNMYANLLAKAMIDDTKDKVHPSFVELIKQLSSDEARILKKLSYDINGNFPIVDLIQKNANGSIEIILNNFTDMGYDICNNTEKITAYYENLDRLKIINIMSGAWITDLSWYEGINNHFVTKEIQCMIDSKGGVVDIRKKYFRFTNYGKDFINTCVR